MDSLDALIRKTIGPTMWMGKLRSEVTVVMHSRVYSKLNLSLWEEISIPLQAMKDE